MGFNSGFKGLIHLNIHRMFRKTCAKFQDVMLIKKCCFITCPIIGRYIATSILTHVHSWTENVTVRMFCYIAQQEICLSDNATKQWILLRVCCFWDYFVTSVYVVSGPTNQCCSSLQFCWGFVSFMWGPQKYTGSQGGVWSGDLAGHACSPQRPIHEFG